MQKCLKRIFLALLFVTLVVSPALAGRWVMLGQQRVDFRAETDVINVGGDEGSFSQIKLKVEDAGVHFNNMVVVFGNNDRFNIAMNDKIPAGGETRVIDLPGKARRIKQIIFNYRTRKGAHEKATVRVLGYRQK